MEYLFMKKNQFRSYTLIELIVVLATIVILSSLLIKVMQKSIETAKDNGCKDSLRQIYLAQIGHTGDNRGWYAAARNEVDYDTKYLGTWYEEPLAPYIEREISWYGCPQQNTDFDPYSYTINAFNRMVKLRNLKPHKLVYKGSITSYQLNISSSAVHNNTNYPLSDILFITDHQTSGGNTWCISSGEGGYSSFNADVGAPATPWRHFNEFKNVLFLDGHISSQAYGAFHNYLYLNP